MFDLEKAIANWRQKLQWRKEFGSEDLKEMEDHLRDEVEWHVASGLSEQKAFFKSIHSFGYEGDLAKRFTLVKWEQTYIKRAIFAPALLCNYLKVATRNLFKNKVYTFINIAGLAIGMACCALILLYVQHELSYDDFHSKGDRIYRVLRETRSEDGSVMVSPRTSGPFAPALIMDFPEVENAVRLYTNSKAWTRYEGERLVHERRSWLFVEPDFFIVFDFPFVKGDPETSLREPGSMVISEATAQQYFGSEDPIGKILRVEPESHVKSDLVVTGVITGVIEVPKNSILQFDMVTATTMLMNNDEIKVRWETWDANYHMRYFQTYILLHEGVDPRTLEAKLPAFMERYMGSETRAKNTYHLQLLKRIHLYSHADYEGSMGRTARFSTDYADIQNVYLFSGIAFLILLIACVNFMNLATARSTNRAKEVGLRKALGAYRFQLIRQFLGEAILLSFLAFVLAVGLVELILPYFSAFVGKDLMPQRHIVHLILVPGLVAFIGLLAGCYPAFFLSAFEPVSVLKGYVKTGLRGKLVRKGLVVFQFAMSILLIIGTVMVYRQLNYRSSDNDSEFYWLEIQCFRQKQHSFFQI